MPVDPFHFKSHAESHESCRLNNDPNLFPQLKNANGKWVFNASAAEMTNVWFGGFASMCRNMLPSRYDFFLDHMIFLRNEWIIEMLQTRKNVTMLGNVQYSGVPKEIFG